MQRTQEPIYAGVLFSETGVTSAIETSQLHGTLLAIEEVNAEGGIDGRELKPICYDPASSPPLYKSMAERLLVEDGVKLIFGCYMSSTRKAVLPVVEKWNGLLFYPTLYEGFEYSANIIYTGAAPNQNSVQLAEFMIRNFGSRVYMVGSDYIYPYESNRIMSDLVMEQHGEKVAERYVKLDAGPAIFDQLMKDVRARKPDFIFSTVVGTGTAHLYRAYADAGLDPAVMPIASLTTSETEVQQMGAAVAAGHITSATYFQSIDSPLNQRCVTRHKARFGADQVTDMCWEAAYFQTHMTARALRASGTDDPRQLLPNLLQIELEAPQGMVRIDAANHHTYLRPRIAQANADGQFAILHEAGQVVKPDPYLVEHTLQDWSAQVRAKAR